MKQKVKVIVAFLLVTLLALSAFGCGTREKNQGLVDHEVKVEGKIKLNYYQAQTESEKRSIREWVAAFEKKYPDCKVQVETTFLSDMTRIDAQISSGSVGDVFFLRDLDLYNYAIVQNALMPLEHYVEYFEIDTANVFNAILEMGMVEGRMYMAMRDYNHIVLSYNKTAIEEANLTDPVELDKNGEWDWDTFKDYCAQLTKDLDGVEGVDQLGAHLRLGYSPVYIPFLEGYGGKWYDTVNKKITFLGDGEDSDSSPVLEGVEEMINLVESKTVLYERNGGAAIEEGSSVFTGISSDNCVFSDMQFPLLSQRAKAYNDKGIEWDLVSFPALPTHRVGTGATGFVVFNETKNPDAAAALCLSLYTEDGQRAYHSQEGGSVPNVKTLAEETFWRVGGGDDVSVDSENGKYYEAFISHPEADTYGQPRCILPPDIADIVDEYMKDLIPNHFNSVKDWSTTVAELQQTANEKWETILEED